MATEWYVGWIKRTPKSPWQAVVRAPDWWTCQTKLLMVFAWPGAERKVLRDDEKPEPICRPFREIRRYNEIRNGRHQ